MGFIWLYITTRPVSVILIIQFFVYGSVVTVARTYVYIYMCLNYTLVILEYVNIMNLRKYLSIDNYHIEAVVTTKILIVEKQRNVRFSTHFEGFIIHISCHCLNQIITPQ